MWDNLKAYALAKKIAKIVLVLFLLSIIRILITMDYSEPYGYWILLHKLGEVFLFIPFYRTGMLWLYDERERKILRYLNRWQYVMLLGGVLNLLAGEGLKGVVWWDWFCSVIFIFGVISQPLGKWLFTRRRYN